MNLIIFTIILQISSFCYYASATEVKLRNVADGWFLAVNGAAEEGSLVGCLPESNSRSQIWDINWDAARGRGTTIPSGNQGSSSRTQVMDEDQSTTGVATWGYPGYDLDNQLWTVRDAPRGFQLVNKGTGRCLTGQGNVQAFGKLCNAGDNAQLWETTDSPTEGHCSAEINRARSDRGIAPVADQSQIRAAAEFHNNYMIQHDCFSHQCDGEPGMGDRVKNQGYFFSVVGEIIAAGSGNCQDAVNLWLNSPGHYNIMMGDYVHFGCAGRSGTPWTCKFASPQSG